MNRRIAVLVAAAIVVSPITAFARVEAAVAAEAVAAQPEARQAADHGSNGRRHKQRDELAADDAIDEQDADHSRSEERCYFRKQHHPIAKW